MSLLITILIFVIVAAVVLWLVQVITANLPISATARNVIIAVIALLLLLVFLQEVGLL